MLAGIVLQAFTTPKHIGSPHGIARFIKPNNIFPVVHCFSATLGGAEFSQAKYVVYGQLLACGTFLLSHDAQSLCWLDNL
jgi:hypothetical protein